MPVVCCALSLLVVAAALVAVLVAVAELPRVFPDCPSAVTF